jgi:hypothetical protein
MFTAEYSYRSLLLLLHSSNNVEQIQQNPPNPSKSSHPLTPSAFHHPTYLFAHPVVFVLKVGTPENLSQPCLRCLPNSLASISFLSHAVIGLVENFLIGRTTSLCQLVVVGGRNQVGLPKLPNRRVNKANDDSYFTEPPYFVFMISLNHSN